MIRFFRAPFLHAFFACLFLLHFGRFLLQNGAKKEPKTQQKRALLRDAVFLRFFAVSGPPPTLEIELPPRPCAHFRNSSAPAATSVFGPILHHFWPIFALKSTPKSEAKKRCKKARPFAPFWSILASFLASKIGRKSPGERS